MTAPGAAPPSNLPVLLRPQRITRPPGPVTSRRVPQEPRQSPVRRRVEVTLAAPPDWAVELPEPARYLKAGWAKVNDGINDGTDRLLIGAVVVGAWYILTARSWVPDLAVTLLWLGALTYGLSVMWQCAAGTAPGRWTTRRAGAVTGALAAVGVLALTTGALFGLMLLSVAAAQLLAHRPAGAKDSNWWGEERLRLALTAAGVLKTDPPVWLRRIGKPSITQAAQSVTVVAVTGPKPGVPLGITADAIRNSQKRLEAVMGLRAGQLHVTHDDDQEAAAITFTVTPPPRRDTVVAKMPDRWDYSEPLFIGNDRLHQPVTRRTWGCHAAFVGTTGSGKTWFGRYDVAHALLDPTVEVYLIDGKGDDRDWTAMHPLCTRVAVGSDVDTGRRALALLEHLHLVAESRRSQPDAHGIVVVIDEWYRLLLEVKRRDPALAAELDALLTGLHATARSRRIRFLTFWQAGTKDYITKAMRVNMGQRFCGLTETSAEVRYFLEQVPQHLPAAAGQFVVKDEGLPATLVTVPALDADAFTDVCEQAAKLRAAEVEAPSDPLAVAVHDLLALGPMKASVLRDMLPEEIRPPTAQALGYALRKMGGVEPVTLGGHRHYRATPGRSPVTAPSRRAEAPTYGTSEASLSVTEAHQGEVVRLP